MNWKALTEAGIQQNALITIRMRNVKVSTALKAILQDAGGNGVRLAYEINDGVLFISTAEEIDKNTEVLVYDVHDLLTTKDDKVDEAVLKQLTEVLQQNIDPSSWAESGGSIGSIKHLNGKLVITQNKANHKRVAALLGKLREAANLQVSIQSHVMTVPRALIKDVGIEIEENAPVRDKEDKPGKTFQGAFLNDDQAAKLIKTVQAAAGATILSSPRMTMFNGQHGSIAIGSEIPYISGWSEPRDGKRVPQISYAKTGFTATLQASVSADRKYLTVKMQPRIAKLRKIDDLPWPQAPAGEKLNIQKPDLAVQEVDTMVSVPDGGTVLTILPQNAEDAKDAKGMVNIMLIRPSVTIAKAPQAGP